MGLVTCESCGASCLYRNNPDVDECDGSIHAIYLTSETFAHVCKAHMKLFQEGVPYGTSNL